MSRYGTPRELGYAMPAEWEAHEATFLSWPKNPLTFPEKIIERVEQIFVQMVDSLAEGETVRILVDDQKTQDRVASKLSTPEGRVQFLRIKSADVWIRDYGPIFVRNRMGNSRAVTKWHFNAWGRKYADLLSDDETGLRVSESTGLEIFQPDMVLEGGSIDTNGRGLCLTTHQCLLNPNRNPGLERASIEACLRDYLGFVELLWLGRGIEGDDTDGHVDDIARFVAPETVVCMVSEEDPSEANHVPLRENYELLRNWHGESSLEVIPIEMPAAQSAGGGDEGRLPASYANFYIGNEVVLLPVFGDTTHDEEALRVLGQVFPTRKIVPIECSSLVYGFGGIHCVTQQEPAT